MKQQLLVSSNKEINCVNCEPQTNETVTKTVRIQAASYLQPHVTITHNTQGSCWNHKRW